ncbi:hypothetical protein [Acidovorax sp. NCPPB 4044]|uniref:hypothetical protein n=1 Tax=Acidovorax sp. NCPPB 4044 TaxID=2940490 RepID=UPI0023037B6B|nr:hypothetical protein [Acidovorax sp. NCPPB 4044]MDA8522298.1 hypothetical protein [Acidovorax sp. NCPPB 4044]
MTAALLVIHWACGVVVLAESLNKLERTAPCRRGLGPRERTTEWLKALAWLLLALGAGCAVARPVLGLPLPDLGDACIALGFAALIVRTRIKEG